ncbi:winged helix DNA-binding domain-containing protein [Actinoplanes sp. NPDC024001]|uniref:winged helix DNA-binding domain-containing protein n=1 Tax=Actinoplanes sp. NPDC024001 TaxID=3154598 RepID=UPI0033DC8C4B
MLLRRARLTVPEALTRLGGLQAQTPHTWYVGLWSRLEDYTADPTAALLTEGAIVRMALMRSTIHLVTVDDCRWLRPLVEPVIVRSTMGAFGRHLTGVDRGRLVEAAGKALAERPMIFSELGRALAPDFPGHDPAALAQAARMWMPLVQVPPRGVWGRSGRPAHLPLEQWPGAALAAEPSVDELFLRYLAAFGPATVRDAQQWCGLTRLAEVADRLRPRLVTFRDEHGAELFDLPDAPRPDADTEAPVRFLYDFDNLLLSHADRTRVVTVDYTVQGWGGGNMEQPRTVLADGFAAATWRIAAGRKAATLTVRPFRRLTAAELDGIQAEGAALLAFHAPGAAQEIVVG